MKKKYVIKKSYEIDHLIKKRDSTANYYFVVYKQKNQFTHYRYAISIGKKYGNAVERNKMKRRIRHIIYKIGRNFQENYDILIIVRPKSKRLTFQEIEQQLTHVLKKGNIYRED